MFGHRNPILHPENLGELAAYLLYIKDGAYFCYCAYVLRVSRYPGFLWVVPINTGIFLRGLKLCGKSGA